MIYARFVLQNFCEKNNIRIDEDCVLSQIQIATTAQNKAMPDPVYSCNSSEGEAIRDILTKYVGINLPHHLVS